MPCEHIVLGRRQQDDHAHLAAEAPAALETIHVAAVRCPDIERQDLQSASLYRLWQTRYGLRAQSAHKTLELTRASSAEARLLNLSAGAPLFLLRSLVTDAGRQVV